MRKHFLWMILSLMWVQPSTLMSPQGADAEKLPTAAKLRVEFRRDIEPLLKEKCQSCHGAEQQLSGLRLDSRSAALNGGNSGAVIKPGNSRESRLIHLVAGLNKELRMPMTGDPLTAEQVGFVARVDRPGSSVARGLLEGSLAHGYLKKQALVLRDAAAPKAAQSQEHRLGSKPDRQLRSSPP